MKEQTGDTYASSVYAKALCASDPKVGKTTFLIAAVLGLLPWQKRGGIVSAPDALHVFSFDANALGGVKRFLTETCSAPTSALNFRVYNMQDDARRVSGSDTDWDYGSYNTFMAAVMKAAERAAKGGTHVMLVSSLTGLAAPLERALAGPPGKQKGGGMDMSKWQSFSHQISEVRNSAQQDAWHCLWEAHIHRPSPNGQAKKDDPPPKESLQVSGKTGQNFGYNVEQIFKIRREFGVTFPGTKCDRVYLDTRPSLDFVAGGRNFTEALAAKEYDMTEAFEKLGLKIGGVQCKAPAKAAVKAAPSAVKAVQK